MERTGHKSDTFMLQVFHNENKQQNFLVTQLELSQWCSHKSDQFGWSVKVDLNLDIYRSPWKLVLPFEAKPITWPFLYLEVLGLTIDMCTEQKIDDI